MTVIDYLDAVAVGLAIERAIFFLFIGLVIGYGFRAWIGRRNESIRSFYRERHKERERK